MINEILETWRMNQAVNVKLLNNLTDEMLSDTYAARVRTVGEQFAHIHTVRMAWLETAAPLLFEKGNKIEKDTPVTVSLLKNSLKRSSELIENLLKDSFEKGKMKGWKKHPLTFMGYLIAHESHHRGLVMVGLRSGEHTLPKEEMYGFWDWGK